MKTRALGLLSLLAIAMLAAACGSDDDDAGTVSGGTAALAGCPTASVGGPSATATPGVEIDTSRGYEAVIKTEKGDIVAELFASDAPVTVNNFVHLARCGYYDDITFHRVISNFMIQTGDPTATGGGGPGYAIPDELSPDLRHDGPGVLSMANAGFGTGGGQFFITHQATPHLDGYEADGSAKPCEIPVVSCHAVFGRVIEGQDVVDSIQGPDPSTGSASGDRLITVEIREK